MAADWVYIMSHIFLCPQFCDAVERCCKRETHMSARTVADTNKMLLVLLSCSGFLFFSQGESLMISLYRLHDYSHHSSAQWKLWEALCCLREPITFIAGNRVQFIGWWNKDGVMMMHVWFSNDHTRQLVAPADWLNQENKSFLIHWHISLHHLNCHICCTCSHFLFFFYCCCCYVMDVFYSCYSYQVAIFSAQQQSVSQYISSKVREKRNTCCIISWHVISPGCRFWHTQF